MAYCPIADIENAALAYAWMRYDSTLNEDGSQTETEGEYEFLEFQMALQEDEAIAFGEYINFLGLTDSEGKPLTFDKKEDGTLNLRSGSYYEAVLNNISGAPNAMTAEEEEPEIWLSEKYGEYSSWLEKRKTADGR